MAEAKEFTIRFPTREVRILTTGYRDRGQLATAISKAQKGTGIGVLSCHQVLPGGSKVRTWINLALVEQVV
jgi:hypothetical protein